MKNIDFTDFFNVFLSGATIRDAVMLKRKAADGLPKQQKGRLLCGAAMLKQKAADGPPFLSEIRE